VPGHILEQSGASSKFSTQTRHREGGTDVGHVLFALVWVLNFGISVWNA
jgi:hypothetical protein